MQIRHNLVVPEKPFFRRGSCVLKEAHYFLSRCQNPGFSGMRPARLSFAIIGTVASAAVGAALWPHARDSFAVLAAQDEPAQLADLGIGSALRNHQALIEENIEAALATGDADLANSFVELARAK